MKEPRPLGAIVGAYVKDFRRRHRISKDQLATRGALYGMSWGRTSIDNIEGAKSAVTIPILFALCNALTDLTPRTSREQATLSAILSDDEHVLLSGEFSVPGASLKAFLQEDEQYPLMVGDTLEEWIRSNSRPVTFTLSERRAAKSLGITPSELRAAAIDLWGELFDYVVTHSVDSDASAQARGHESRRRVAELRAHLEDEFDG